MWQWYWIGLAAGLGVAFGALDAGILAPTPVRWIGAAISAAAISGAVAYVLYDWKGAVAAAVGGFAGAAGAGQIVRGSLDRGATRGGLAILLAGIAVGLGVLALLPVVGYLEVVGVPGIGARARRKAIGGRYAGLRILARD